MTLTTPNDYKAACLAEVKTVLAAVFRAINGGKWTRDDAATVIAEEHPTLTAQLAKAVAIGVMRRTVGDLNWRAFDKTTDVPSCLDSVGKVIELGNGERFILPKHPSHDGRWDCETVVAAELLARQSYI